MIATPANPSASIERRLEAVVNSIDAAGVGNCMLTPNKRGFVYTNNGVSGTEIRDEPYSRNFKAIDLL